MLMISIRPALALISFIIAAPLAAHGFTVGQLKIGHPWSRESAPGQKVGAGFLTITNTGTTDDRLLSASSSAAEQVQVHTAGLVNGVMRMRELKDGLAIPAGATVTLAPGGYHIMLIGLKGPLVRGAMIPAELRFAKAGRVKISFKVEAITATEADHAAH
jgi:copper(I)-binding protein